MFAKGIPEGGQIGIGVVVLAIAVALAIGGYFARRAANEQITEESIKLIQTT